MLAKLAAKATPVYYCLHSLPLILRTIFTTEAMLAKVAAKATRVYNCLHSLLLLLRTLFTTETMLAKLAAKATRQTLLFSATMPQVQ
jgi:hypothetical protein